MIKLKTLKDLRCKIREKDLDPELFIMFKLCYDSMIRAEAIKWVKSFHVDLYNPGLLDKEESMKSLGSIEVLMAFSNITEDDLK